LPFSYRFHARGEAILLDLASGYYFSLNRVGAVIWELLDGERTLGAIQQAVCGRFEASPETVWADLEALARRLCADKLATMAELGQRVKTYDNLRELLARSGRGWLDRVRGAPPAAAADNREFWALRDVSFEVQRGDTLGIVGANGAGKTTLLKIISRIADPTAGWVRVRGRTASLLEVGTGFHPELTGRENIYLNGAILGMKRSQIRARFDQIVAFAGIGRFLDTPVKRYSSGMYVRLAFSVAAHLESEILIADEVLAVGDAAFQKKCLGKMAEARTHAASVLFVSHNLAALESICNRGLVLEHGAVAFTGPIESAIRYYLQSAAVHSGAGESHVAELDTCAGRRLSSKPLLRRLELYTGEDQPVRGVLPAGASLKAVLEFELERPMAGFDAQIAFDSWAGQRMCTAHSGCEPDRSHHPRTGKQVFVCEIPRLPLLPGVYRLNVALEIGGRVTDSVEDAMRLKVVPSDYYGTGMLPERGAFLVDNRWTLR
jgi:lipopolysaccharide transport system ATP-binding protein